MPEFKDVCVLLIPYTFVKPQNNEFLTVLSKQKCSPPDSKGGSRIKDMITWAHFAFMIPATLNSNFKSWILYVAKKPRKIPFSN
jgi:hypothetical protein